MSDNFDYEPIFYALAQRMATVRWTRPGDSTPNTHQFVTVTRRIALFGDVPSPSQPWCGQAEHGEVSEQITGMPYKTTLEATWIIMHCFGKDKNALPTVENNVIITGIRNALAPLPADPGFLSKRNTLNGLVYHCFISGRIFKDPGDLDDQALITVPIKLLVP